MQYVHWWTHTHTHTLAHSLTGAVTLLTPSTCPPPPMYLVHTHTLTKCACASMLNLCSFKYPTWRWYRPLFHVDTQVEEAFLVWLCSGYGSKFARERFCLLHNSYCQEFTHSNLYRVPKSIVREIYVTLLMLTQTPYFLSHNTNQWACNYHKW